MVSKDDIHKVLVEIVTKLSTRSQLLMFSFLPNAESRFEELLDDCIDLQKELVGIGNSEIELLELQKKVYAIEVRYKRLRAKAQLIPAVVLLYFGIGGVFFLFRFIDIPKFVTVTLGVEAPEKLITLGIAGAFLYLATSLLTKIEAARSLSLPQLQISPSGSRSP